MDCLHYPYNTTYYEYNTHNLFGLMEGIATKNALESFYNKRSFVLSRSTFAGSGHHVAHWLGDKYVSCCLHAPATAHLFCAACVVSRE